MSQSQLSLLHPASPMILEFLAKLFHRSITLWRTPGNSADMLPRIANRLMSTLPHDSCLRYGVETLCFPTDRGCTVYSEPLGTFNVPTFPSPYKESSMSRDAFCAALAAKLIDSGQQFSEEVALWATAAMAAAIADHPLPNPMPDRRRVEQLLLRSRFSISPRVAQISDAGDAYAEQGQLCFPTDADNNRSLNPTV